MRWIRTIAASALKADEPHQVRIEDHVIGLYRLEDGVFAIADVCTHQHAFLSEGLAEGGLIECPMHQARFDIRTGKYCGPHGYSDLPTYPVRVEDGAIYVGIE